MPTVEVSVKDLEKLVGVKMGRTELDEALMYVKGEIDGEENGVLKIDIKDTNRPDLWSAEGIARELRARLGKEKGIPKYKMKKSKVTVKVEKSVEKVRPLIVASIIRNVKVTDDLLVQMIQLQEKVAQTFGRKRKEVAIGLYDLDKIKPPVFYRAYKPREIKFVPLEFQNEMDLDEILELHPKGQEFGGLLKDHDRYPIVIDSADVVSSMPPIINSEHTGKVTEDTKNIFIEVTGFREDLINIALDVITTALAERGGRIEQVKIIPFKGKSFWSPDFIPKSGKIKLSEINKRSGFKFRKEKVVELLKRARYDVTAASNNVKVKYPSYRGDILHPVDIIEDLLIGYGYNNIEPQAVEMAVIGEERPETKVQENAREACIGLGLQEVLTFTMTSIEKQQNKIKKPKAEFVEIANPISLNWQVMRRSLIPELLEFLSKNKDVSYPQRIFEVGKCVIPHIERETKVDEIIKLCVAVSDTNAGFTEIKSALNEIANYLGLDVKLNRVKDSTFIEGRCAEITINGKKGIIGEISEEVKKNFGIENSVALFEIVI